MKRLIAIASAAIAVAVAVCDLADAQGSRSRRQSGTSQENPPPPPNQRNQGLAVAAPVSAIGFFGREGGRLTVTAPDGWRYELEIPRLALFWGERIEMTVLPVVEGLPAYMRQPRGVMLSPAGVTFAREVVLTVTPPQTAGERALLALLSTSLHDGRALPTLYAPVAGGYRVSLWNFAPLRLAAVDPSDLDRLLAHLDQTPAADLRLPWAAEAQRLLEALGAGPARLDDWVAQITRSAHGALLKRLASPDKAFDQAHVARLGFVLSAADNRVLKPLLEKALSREATCAEMVQALRAALALEAIRRNIGIGTALPVVDRLLSGELSERIAKICEGSCGKSGDLAVEADLNILRARLRELQGRETADLLTLVERLEQVEQGRLSCMRYQVKVSTRQQNVSIAPAYGLVHDLRVEDEVVANVSAQIADLLDDEGKPVREATGRPIRRLAVRGEGEHRPTNYVYNFEDRNKSQTCFTMNAANTAVARDRMMIELAQNGTGFLVRVRPGNITLNFWHWTCTLKKESYPFDDLWRNGFSAAYPLSTSGGMITFPVAHKSAYPEIGHAELSGVGTNPKSSPENEDLRTTQTTVISILHKP